MNQLAYDIVGNLKQLGYEAEVQDTPYTKGKRAGEPRCEVHVKTGKPVNVFLDLINEDKPQFRSFANYTLDGIAEHEGFKRAKWIEGQKGKTPDAPSGIEKYNRERGFEEGLRFKGPLLAAFCAARYGIPLQEMADAFRIARKGKGVDATEEVDLGDGFDAATDFTTSAAAVPTARPTANGMKP